MTIYSFVILFFPILNQSIVPCPILTVASWPAFSFLSRQVRWSGIPISWRIFHSLWWSTQRARHDWVTFTFFHSSINSLPKVIQFKRAKTGIDIKVWLQNSHFFFYSFVYLKAYYKLRFLNLDQWAKISAQIFIPVHEGPRNLGLNKHLSF